MPAATLPLKDTLPTSLSKIFDQVQSSIANHQKNSVALYKLHSNAAEYTDSVDNGRQLKLSGERLFEDTFLDMVNRVLVIKKGVGVADRIVKFVGGYVKVLDEKITEVIKSQGLDEDDDTTASRFMSRLFKYLLKAFVAKDKVIRYRAVHFIAEIVSHLGEMDEEIYSQLRAALMERVYDKEATIRVQSVIALAKLAGSENPTDVNDGEATVLETLIDILKYDTSADVRRATLVNIPLSPVSLPHLLARTRDIDSVMRKLVYSAILEPNCYVKDDSKAMGFTHPRVLTIATREMIVRHGLGDREPAVRVAAAGLVATWVEVIRSSEETIKEESGVQAIQQDIVAFLKMFDLPENTVAADALVSVFKTRVDLFENVEFEDAFWDHLTPEKAFFARVFVDYCIEIKDNGRLETTLPVVTSLAFRIQERYNELLTNMQEEEEERLLRLEERDDDKVRREEERVDREFVIGEMLKLAVNLDYADEIGRRKMFQLVRDMISQEALPDSLVARCLDVLRKLSASERDLIRVVVEVVHELRDANDSDEDVPGEPTGDDDDTSFAETPAPKRIQHTRSQSDMTPEERAKADAMDLRCLSLCIGMLERVNSTFEENSTLEGVLGELIIPAVRKKEMVLREKGLVSLGLCCLIARRLALNSLQLFLSQVQTAPEALKLRVLQVVFDMLMVHEPDFLAKGSENAERIIEFLLNVLEHEESEQVQACLCIGLAKLVLSGMVDNERALKSLVLLYVSPDTTDNQELRQCLSYFFPAFCYSSPSNQRRMQKLFIPVYQQLCQVYKDLDDEHDMVSPLQVGSMFVDWTDSEKAVEVQGRPKDETIHIEMANDIVKALFNEDMDKDDKKTLCQLLGKLNLVENVDDDKIKTLKLLVYNLQSRRPLKDAVARNAFARFDAMISKKYEKQLQDFSEDQYRQLEYLKEMFEFLDDIIPDEEEEIVLPKGKKRRSQSIVTNTTTTSGNETDSTRSRTKGKTKRLRLSQSDDEPLGGDRIGRTPPTAVPTRPMPRRAAAQKGKQKVVIEISDDEETTPVPKQPQVRTGRYRKAKEEADLDADIDNLLDGGAVHDSIMDNDSDGEEDEVGGMLDGDEE